jgi:Na+-transporting methylmalonyl-CoA/oxaloacetate decarboxylase gamma subunit
MNISPLALYLIMLGIAVLFSLLVLEAAVFWLGSRALRSLAVPKAQMHTPQDLPAHPSRNPGPRSEGQYTAV